LSCSQYSRLAYASINGTLNNFVANTPASVYYNQPQAVPPVLNTSTATAQFLETNSFYPAFHDNAAMDIMYNMTNSYLDVALNRSSLLYRDSVANLMDSYSAANKATLAAFVVLNFLMFVLFYNPMCWQLDSEQKRTSSMLLMIPADVMERLPTIRQFVEKLGVKD
jgi:hypothetical protein